APQIPRGNGAIRHPFAGMPLHRYRRWQALVTIGTLDGLADAQIVHRKDIESAERKNEKHFRGPAPNSFNVGQLPNHFYVAVCWQSREPERTILDFSGQIVQVSNFLA